MRTLLLFAIIGIGLTFASCGGKKTENATHETVQVADPNVGDSMVYGLACDGTTDSVILVYPFSGEDPVTYNIIDAKQAGRVIGKPTIGDWVGLVLDPEDTTSAKMVINLDLLKGTWTYPVMPSMKDFLHLSKRMQRRMERQAMQEMPDSLKELYMVPREYGFSLKRGHVAQPVGRVYSGSTLEDDSPVEYPKVKQYKQWYVCNGRLVLVSGERVLPGMEAKADAEPDVRDTLDFVSLDEDSLVLISNGVRYGFHRKASAMTANAAATKKAQQAAEKKVESIKK